MREATFTTELIRSFRKDKSWIYKIPDAPTSRLTGLRFTASKPCDLVLCLGGKFVAIECKQIKKWKAFSIGDMRTSQIVNLPAVIKSGGRAFVFLNVRIAKEKVNRIIVLDWEVYGPRLERASIKATELKSMPYLPALDVKDKIFFDLTDFYGWVNLF